MKRIRITKWAVPAFLALAIAGCSSNKNKHIAEEPSADTSEQNHMLIRMALAENVYSGIAAERAVYDKDFDLGQPELNELGARRVQTLIETTRNGRGEIVVLQGDAPDDLYTARVETVRRRLADTGVNLKEVTAIKGTLVGGETTSTARTLIAYDKMLTSYQQKDGGKERNAILTLQPVSNKQ